jgi:hypothetical protein
MLEAKGRYRKHVQDQEEDQATEERRLLCGRSRSLMPTNNNNTTQQVNTLPNISPNTASDNGGNGDGELDVNYFVHGAFVEGSGAAAGNSQTIAVNKVASTSTGGYGNSRVVRLDLPNQGLSGALPLELKLLPQLLVLDVSNNNLTSLYKWDGFGVRKLFLNLHTLRVSENVHLKGTVELIQEEEATNTAGKWQEINIQKTQLEVQVFAATSSAEAGNITSHVSSFTCVLIQQSILIVDEDEDDTNKWKDTLADCMMTMGLNGTDLVVVDVAVDVEESYNRNATEVILFADMAPLFELTSTVNNATSTASNINLLSVPGGSVTLTRPLIEQASSISISMAATALTMDMSLYGLPFECRKITSSTSISIRGDATMPNNYCSMHLLDDSTMTCESMALLYGNKKSTLVKDGLLDMLLYTNLSYINDIIIRDDDTIVRDAHSDSSKDEAGAGAEADNIIILIGRSFPDEVDEDGTFQASLSLIDDTDDTDAINSQTTGADAATVVLVYNVMGIPLLYGVLA